MVSSEYTHTRTILQTETVVFMYIHICMQQQSIKNEATDLKESIGKYMKGFGDGKGRDK